eukprot:gene2874-5639_t
MGERELTSAVIPGLTRDRSPPACRQRECTGQNRPFGHRVTLTAAPARETHRQCSARSEGLPRKDAGP